MSEAKLSTGARRFIKFTCGTVLVVVLVIIALGYFFYYVPRIQSQKTAPPPEVIYGETENAVTAIPETTEVVVSVPENTEVLSTPFQPEQSPEEEDIYQDLPEVKVGLDAFAPYYTLLLAKQLGLDAFYGINIDPITFYTGEDLYYYSETERTEFMESGEWDALFTTMDKLALRPEIGKLTAFVDETDGADKLVCTDEVQNLNDLAGKRIGYFSESIGEFFVYYLLGVAEIGPEEVALVGSPDSVADVVQLYNDGHVDCVSGWEPDVDDAVGRGAHVLISTSSLRVALDVIISSNHSLQNRTSELEALHNAYFEAMRFLLEHPDEAETALIEWLVEEDMIEWSDVGAPGDWIGWLETTPQATLSTNVAIMRNEKAFRDRLVDACRTWSHAGFETPECTSEAYKGLIETSYVESASTNPAAITTASAVNPSFLFTSTPVIGEVSDEQLSAGIVIATLPFEKIPFLPDRSDLTPEAVTLLTNKVLTVMKISPALVLSLTGSAALPSDEVRFTEEGSKNFALTRANTVRSFLADPREFGVDADGIDINRIVVSTVDPQFPRSTNLAELEKDRFVRFELIDIGY